MNSLQEQLMKAGLICEKQIEEVEKAQVAAAEAAAAPSLPTTLCISSERVLFGSMANIYRGREQADSLSLLEQHGLNQFGALDFSMTYWLPVLTGDWLVQRVMTGKRKPTTQAYWITHNSIDALVSLKRTLRIAGRKEIACSPAIRDKGILVIDSYQWAGYDIACNGFETHYDKFSGPDCGFVADNAIDAMEQCLQSLQYIDNFAPFDGGCIMSFKDHEHMHARILLDESQQKVAGFLYFSGYSKFKDAHLEGSNIF